MNVATPIRTDSATQPPASPRADREAPFGPALRAMMFKEFRPTLPFALVILAFIWLLTVLPSLLDFLYPSRDPLRESDMMNVLANVNFEQLLVPMAAMVGLALGIAQAAFARGTDQWAFLAHRPIRRGYLFLGRVLALLSLYGIAAGVPACVLVIYSAFGRPPHDWHMYVPVLVDFATGLVYLFAGMLMVERKVFIAWRVLPAAGLLILSAGVVVLPWAVASLVLIAGFATVLGLAALGSHVSHGNRLPAPRVTHAATVLTLFLGGTVLLGGAAIALKSAANSLFEDWQNRIEQQPSINNGAFYRGRLTRYALLPDGTIAKAMLTLPRVVDPATGDSSDWTYYAVDSGQSIPQPNHDQMNELTSHSTSIGVSRFYNGYREVLSGSPIPGGIKWELGADGVNRRLETELWFVMPNAGIVKGYDVATRAYIGSIGVDGFVPPGHAAQPFASIDGMCLGPQGEYTVDVATHTTRLQMAFPPGFVLRGRGFIDVDWSSPNPGAHSDYAILRGDDRLLIFDQRSSPAKCVATLMLANPHADYVGLTALRAPQADGSAGGWAVRYVEGDRSDPWSVSGVTYDIYDPTGKQIRHQAFPEVMTWDPPRQLSHDLMKLEHSVRLTAGILDGLGNLPALEGVVAIRKWANPSTSDYFMDPYSDWYLGGAAIPLVISAGAVLWMARRYRLRTWAAWGAAALVFGPVVGLVLIATHNLPRRGLCPNCGARRAFVTEKCPRCGKPWPKPAANGTEIFA